MNCSPSDRKSLPQCQVISKYFSEKTGMDESLTDFQEKKKNIKGPKKTEKATKKHTKRIRGQKDIRTVLKHKTSDLVAFSNDFDKVCKQSGIDVDPEQLQLAIALSKSLQKDENSNNQSSGSLTTQERTGKIRSTLQEYGFVVPEVKIFSAKSKKLKKYRKNYKLLVTTKEEKQQVISDRYSKVLFDNFVNSNSHTTNSEVAFNSSTRLFNLVTNVEYEQIKDNKILYIENLVEKSEFTIGSLLKNWAEIPGRPSSPIKEVPELDFAEINCSQEELDYLLSGPLKVAQEIFKSKYSLLNKSHSNKDIQIKTDNKLHNNIKMDEDDVEIVEIHNFKKLTEAVDKPNSLTVTQNVRSYSPDIFDDEVSSIMDSSQHDIHSTSQKAVNLEDCTHLKQQNMPFTNLTKICEVSIDLTECAVVDSQRNNFKPLSQLSQGTEVTKRNSNDFMDVTECVTGSSQAIREEKIEQNIDLTQNSDDKDISDCTKAYKTVVNNKVIESMDLTQSSESNELPVVHISGTESVDDTIIMNDSYSDHKKKSSHEVNTGKEIKGTEANESNTQTYTKTTSPIVIESPECNKPDEAIAKEQIEILSDNEETDSSFLLSNSDTYARAVSPIVHINESILTEDDISTFYTKQSRTNPIREKSISPIEQDNYFRKSKTDSFFEEFIHNHSDNSKEKSEVLCIDNLTEKNDELDLKQNSDLSENNIRTSNREMCSQIPNNINSLGTSATECDEIFDEIVRTQASSSKSLSYRSNTADSNSDNKIKLSSNNSDIASSSQTSEVFEISDNELDYSLHQSKLDGDVSRNVGNFEFGGSSIMDNLSDMPSFKRSRTTFNRSLSESYLPEVDIRRKGHESTIYSPDKSCSLATKSPCKEVNKELVVKTPKNSEYVIKTDQVTPMIDYEAMSTPEMNAELDKYGLKPFKRKRAVQLLTHLYNQTHPILQSCSTDDITSPSKKFKTSLSPKKVSRTFKSPTKGPSPRKKEGDENHVTDKDNDEITDIYDVTSELPVLRDLTCDEEEWVFQKREKAKVQSCRVPLHIAFHNYVSSRLRLREAILRYEPVNIDVIHKGLVSNGFRYDPKDLLKFMDKKCITVKTADNTSNKSNKKH